MLRRDHVVESAAGTDSLVETLRREYPTVDVAEIERVCARGRALLRPHVRHTLTDAVEWYARARLSLLRSGETVDEIVTLMSALRESPGSTP